MVNDEIIYISFNDWDDNFESPKCKDFMKGNINSEKLPFNWDVGVYDQAMVFVITTTEKDLLDNGYEEFLKNKIDPETDDGLWTAAYFFKENGEEENCNGWPFPPYKYSMKTKFNNGKN